MAEPSQLAAALAGWEDPQARLRLALQGADPAYLSEANLQAQHPSGVTAGMFARQDAGVDGSSRSVSPRVGYQMPIGGANVGAGAALDVNAYHGPWGGQTTIAPRFDASIDAPIGAGRANVGANYSREGGPGYSAGVSAPLFGGDVTGQAQYSPDRKDIAGTIMYGRRF